MKKSALSTLALLFGLLALGGTAMADDQQKYKSVPKMKLSPTFQMPTLHPVPVFDRMAQLCGACKDTEAKTRAAHAALHARYNQCRNEDYTAAEQAAAGCRGTDTVAQCNAKLFNRCTKAARDHYATARGNMVRTCTALINEVREHMNRYHAI